jgi:hypothetical protein
MALWTRASVRWLGRNSGPVSESVGGAAFEPVLGLVEFFDQLVTARQPLG